MTDQKNTQDRILKSDAPLYSISDTADMTGVDANSIRTWERSYSIVNPTRTLKGDRLYSNADISRITRATMLVQQGVQINQVAKILAQELGPLLDVIPQANRGDKLEWQEHRKTIITCLETRDIGSLNKLHHHLFDNYSALELHEMLCNSILGELKTRGEKDPRLAGPHYTYLSFLNAFLGYRAIISNYPADNPMLLIVNRSKLHHIQIRTLWYILVLVDAGYNISLLDQNPPMETVVEAGKRKIYDAAIIIRHSAIDAKEIEEQLAPLLPTFMIGEHYQVNKSALHQVTLLPNIPISANIAALQKHLS